MWLLKRLGALLGAAVAALAVTILAFALVPHTAWSAALLILAGLLLAGRALVRYL